MTDKWMNVQINLSHLITSELNGPKEFASKRQANDYIRRLFVRYNDLMRKFDDIHQRLIHPQKRLLLQILLDGIIGRLIELKFEMIKFDCCEYTYFEDLALDQNKTLDDLSLKIPYFITENCSKSIKQRNQLIKQILDRLNQSKTDLSLDSSIDNILRTKSDLNNELTKANAIRILQAHERARQGRVHAYFMRQMKTQLKNTQTNSINDDNLHQCCLVIQTIWRQKYAEKQYQTKQIEQELLLGMSLPRKKQSYEEIIDNQKSRYLQTKYQEDFEEASIFIKQKIRQYEQTEYQSRLEHVLFQWLLESRQLYGQFPIYPSEEINGSAILFKDMTTNEIEEFVNKQVQALKNKKKKIKQTKKQIKKSKKNPTKQKTTLNQLEPSKFISIINDQLGVYKELFYERDETYNLTQEYDQLLAIDHFRPEVEEELRHDVDMILRNELIYLKLAIDNVEDKKSKKKKKKKKKKKRKKKSKDIVSNRTNDSIFEELVETKILLPTKSVRQQDFLGDYQYSAETLRYNEKEPMPSILDCQQLVILQIIFPLSSETIHRNLPSHKTVLLAGPDGSGKELLVHIACNELGGILLDISPVNLARSFNTADGLRILFAMIKRLVTAMPPVLCLIHDTELLFSKKLNSQEKEYQPRRLQRLIRRFIKKFKPGERIMFIGLSNQPYRARIKSLLQIFKSIILFPRPNYGSRRKILHYYLIEKYQINIIDVELSLLASISNGYTAGQILETIQQVIQNKQSNKICLSNDFLPILAMKSPVFLDEENKIKSWYNKTPNGRKRLQELSQISFSSPQKRRI